MTGVLEFDRCEECGDRRLVCPECGSTYVTQNEPMQKPKYSTFIRTAEDGDQFETKDICWNCDWERNITVTVTVHD